MKKTLYILVAASVFSLLTIHTSAMAAKQVSNATAGATVTVNSDTPGASNLVFNPSTNVNIDGQSDATAFAIFGWHDQTELKASGQAYGMASDENKLYFTNISDDMVILDATIAAVGTNSAAFADWTTI